MTSRAAAAGRGALWAGAGLAALMAGYLWIRYGSANLVRVESPAMPMHVDFETFQRSAAALWHHGDLYVTGAMVPNLDPPFSTVLYSPFGLVSMLHGYRLFALVTMVAMLGCYALLARELKLRPGVAGLALCAMFASSPLLSTIALGQVYGILLAGLVGCWFADRTGRPVLAGILLGVVIALKPTLAPLVFWPIARRDRRMSLAAIGGAAGGTLIGFLVPGPSQTWQWLQLMTETTISPGGDNASLPALVLRLGGPAWIGFGLGAVVLALTLWRIWRGADQELAQWAMVAATLLMSPVAWHNYLVLVFPGVLVLLSRGKLALGALLLALPLIGVEWAWLFVGDGLRARLGHSLYCAILFGYWLSLRLALRPGPPVAPSVPEFVTESTESTESVTESTESVVPAGIPASRG